MWRNTPSQTTLQHGRAYSLFFIIGTAGAVQIPVASRTSPDLLRAERLLSMPPYTCKTSQYLICDFYKLTNHICTFDHASKLSPRPPQTVLAKKSPTPSPSPKASDPHRALNPKLAMWIQVGWQPLRSLEQMGPLLVFIGYQDGTAPAAEDYQKYGVKRSPAVTTKH